MTSDPQSLAVENLGCYGKLPISREFVVEDARSVAASGFDRWVSEGVGMVKARLGTRSDQRISTFPHYRFFWDGGDLALAGVIVPSADEAGRRHPFALFATLRGTRHSALDATLQSWSLQERLATLYGSVVAGGSPAAIREALRAARSETTASMTEARDVYRQFLAERAGDVFWPIGSAAAGERFTVLQALVETVEPAGGNEQRGFRGGIRYPLASEGPGRSALDTCFWIDFTERYMKCSITRPWILRSPCEPGSDGCHLHLFLSPPSPNHWISLVDPEADLESISYLDRPYGAVPPATRMAPGLRALLESETATLGDVVAWAAET